MTFMFSIYSVLTIETRSVPVPTTIMRLVYRFLSYVTGSLFVSLSRAKHRAPHGEFSETIF